MDANVLLGGAAGVAAVVAFIRLRPLLTRVRRDPIDVELMLGLMAEAECADAGEGGPSAELGVAGPVAEVIAPDAADSGVAAIAADLPDLDRVLPSLPDLDLVLLGLPDPDGADVELVPVAAAPAAAPTALDQSSWTSSRLRLRPRLACMRQDPIGVGGVACVAADSGEGTTAADLPPDPDGGQ